MDEFFEIAKAKIREVLANREEILSAFIAKYGYNPDEIEQVLHYRSDGDIVWRVRLRGER